MPPPALPSCFPFCSAVRWACISCCPLSSGCAWEAFRDQENPRRDVRGEFEQRDGAAVLQPVPPFWLPVPELALLRRRQDRTHPLHGEVGRAVAAHHDL